MMKPMLLRLLLLALALAGCVSSAKPTTNTFIRVRGAPACIYVLEEDVAGRPFHEAELVLYGRVRWSMPSHRLGALPAATGVFRLWPGQKDPKDVTAVRVHIPRSGGPWRGLVAELCNAIPYPATKWQPVPAQPPGPTPIVTKVLHCTTPNILACVPWADAVDHGLITCEDSLGNAVTNCRAFVPYTWWRVNATRRP